MAPTKEDWFLLAEALEHKTVWYRQDLIHYIANRKYASKEDLPKEHYQYHYVGRYVGMMTKDLLQKGYLKAQSVGQKIKYITTDRLTNDVLLQMRRFGESRRGKGIISW